MTRGAKVKTATRDKKWTVNIQRIREQQTDPTLPLKDTLKLNNKELKSQKV